MENKQLEDAYNQAVEILRKAKANEASMASEINSLNIELSKLAAQQQLWAQNSNLIPPPKMDNVKVLEGQINAINSLLGNKNNQLETLRGTFNDLQKNIDTAYKNWIDWKKANMTPDELSEYVNVGVAAQNKVSLLQSKQFYIIVASIILLGTVSFILYKKYFSK